MVRTLISLALHLAGNAIGLIVASLVLSDMSISAGAFLVAVLIFSAVEVVAQPFFTSMAMRHVEALRGGTALITTFVGLVITVAISNGLHIHGVWTWVFATLIVWGVSLLAAIVLPAIFLKNRVEARRA